MAAFHVKQPKLREVEVLAQSHTARRWWSWSQSPDSFHQATLSMTFVNAGVHLPAPLARGSFVG